MSILNMHDSEPVNILPQNNIPETSQPDTFFNSIVPTINSGTINSSKNWQRIYCVQLEDLSSHWNIPLIMHKWLE